MLVKESQTYLDLKGEIKNIFIIGLDSESGYII